MPVAARIATRDEGESEDNAEPPRGVAGAASARTPAERASVGGDGGAGGDEPSSSASSSLGAARRPLRAAAPAPQPKKKRIKADPHRKVVALCQQKHVVWAKVDGHHWPAQVVQPDARLAKDKRFVAANRERHHDDDTCVMLFGTCSVAWVNYECDILAWEEGLDRGLNQSLLTRPFFKTALKEVLAYCARMPMYPRTWWCEPACFSNAHTYIDIMGKLPKEFRSAPPILKKAQEVAEVDRVCWARVRGYCFWPAQVLPHDVAVNNYKELELAGDVIPNPQKWPCMFFGTGEVAMVGSKQIMPFITGSRKELWKCSTKTDFIAALGDMWGYLQTPRVSPSYARRRWWDHRPANSGAAQAARETPDLPDFVHIKQSVYARGVRRPSPPLLAAPSICNCKRSSSSSQASCVDSSCLNVASQYWCDPASCPAGKRCANKPFHLRRSPRVSPFFTADERGWGLRLDETVRKGQFIAAYVGELLDKDALDERFAEKAARGDTRCYAMDTNTEWFVDAEHKGGLARFINSSCNPNCESQKWTDPATGQTHVGIFAIQKIEAGKELTYKYCHNLGVGLDTLQVGHFECRCKSDNCFTLNQTDRELVARLVGSRIKVKWDDGWYNGKVLNYHPSRKRFNILYDDGDDEDLALGIDKSAVPVVDFKLLDQNDNEIKL